MDRMPGRLLNPSKMVDRFCTGLKFKKISRAPLVTEARLHEPDNRRTFSVNMLDRFWGRSSGDVLGIVGWIIR